MTRLLVLAGDGIGPEVTQAACHVLAALEPGIELAHGTVGRAALAEHGTPLSPEVQAHLADGWPDGVLFGATETRPGEPSAVLALRRACGSRLSIRPARSRGATSRSCDVTVYRELTEDLYVQDETPTESGAVAHRPITRQGTRRFAEMALDHLPPGADAVVTHKATVLPLTDGLFRDTVLAVAHRRGVVLRDRLVDALTHDLAVDATGPLHVLAPNLYGDILSDLTAGLAGGLGTAPSLTLGDGPPIAEPVHGTAPDIAGQGIANPTATLLALSMLLDHLDHTPTASRIQQAVQAALTDPEARTPDLGGQATTRAFTEAVLARLEVPA